MRYRLPRRVLAQTFAHFRECGRGRRECQALWISPWDSPETITHVVHGQHSAHLGGFELNDAWLHQFCMELGSTNSGIRVQVHTHPMEAFHSETDDAYPIVHTTGFLSLVIPAFAQGQIGFEGAYLTEIQPDGSWREVSIAAHLELFE